MARHHGHRPLSNSSDGSIVHESMVARQTNRRTLPYYEGPRRRDPTIREAAIIMDPAGPEGPGLPDVAVASFGDSTVLELVIGADDRVRLAEGLTGRNPWRQICALRITSQTGKRYVGTGWWISPTAVATAGHCVYLQNEGGWAASVDVITAKHGSRQPYGVVQSTTFHAVDGWTAGREKDFDYGVIEVKDTDIGQRVGNFAVRALDDDELEGVVAKISGYPADRDQAAYQYFHERPLINASATRLTYDVDTFGGQSGSAIFCDTLDHGRVVIGIHTTGGFASNSGTRITEPVLANLVKWSR